MQPIELIMKIWGIADEDRNEVEKVLQNTQAEYLGLALANLGAAADEQSAEQSDAWMDTYLPELRFA